MFAISGLQFALHLFMAIFLGGLVGVERQWRQRTAGTRTNALVSAGAAAFVMSGLLVPNDGTAEGRIVSYVVSGVGFLGAGVIFKDGGTVRGLNTAATIWCSAAIGVCAGLGALRHASILAFFVLFTNICLRPLAYKLHPGNLPSEPPLETLYEITIACRTHAEAHLRAVLLATIAEAHITLQGIHSEDDTSRGVANLRADVVTPGRNNQAVEQIVVRLSIEEDVVNISWSTVQSTME